MYSKNQIRKRRKRLYKYRYSNQLLQVYVLFLLNSVSPNKLDIHFYLECLIKDHYHNCTKSFSQRNQYFSSNK